MNTFFSVCVYLLKHTNKPIFSIYPQGIPSVRIMFDDRIIPTAWDTERKLTNAELECRVDEAILPFNITWFIDSSMQHVDVYQVLLSNFTSVLLFNSTKIHTNVTCQVRGPFLVTQSATIMVVSPVTEMPTSKKNDETSNDFNTV